MLLHGITLAPLDEEPRAAESGILYPFYADDKGFDGLARQSAHLLKLLMERGMEWGYLPDPLKSVFISDTPGREEVARWEFAADGLVLNFVSGSWYLGAYMGPQEELATGFKPQVEAWA